MSNSRTAMERSRFGNGPNRTTSQEPAPALLYTRTQAARLLACSPATLIRAEARGDLRAVRLNPTANSRAYYRASDIQALAEGVAKTRTTRGGEIGLEWSPEGKSITPAFAPSNERECSPCKAPSITLLELIASALATQSDQGGYPLFRDLVSNIVRESLADKGYELSKRQFKIAIWNRFDRAVRKGGRRTQEDRTRFDADAPELRKIVQRLACDSIYARC